MGKELLAKDIFKRNYFRSYSEFYLALAMGSILHNKGYSLNMDGMQVDSSSIPKDMIKYYKRLLSDGALTLSMFEKGVSAEEVANTDIDTTYFDKIPLHKENGNTLDWSLDYAKESYGEYKKYFLEFLKLGNTLVHLVASHLIDVILDGNKQKLILHFDSHQAKSTFIYVNIYSCLQTMTWVRDYVGLDIDFDGYSVDLDYSIFCNNGKVAGRHKYYTVSEKLDLIKKYGMVGGAVLVLWSRGGMCENNEFGQITDASIIRLEEIGDTYLGVTKIALNKTKEEVRSDYYDIEESIRSLFIDMLDKKPYQQAMELDIHGLGVDNYFYDEGQFITLLDENEEVSKLVTIDGEECNIQMSEVNSIYWLLCQYGIEFDKELFKNMYFKDEEPLWDTHGNENE